MARWGGDPVAMFRGVSTYEEACVRIERGNSGEGFYGFRKKMVSLFTYFLMDAGFIDPFHFPIPVDFHVLRIFLAHDLVRVEGASFEEGFFSEALCDVLREFLLRYCTQFDSNPLQLSSAIWLFSGSMCNRQPGNRTLGIKKQGLGASPSFLPVPITWSSVQTRQYEQTCGSCVIEPTCRFNVPSAPVYAGKNFIQRGARRQSPQSSLFLKVL